MCYSVQKMAHSCQVEPDPASKSTCRTEMSVAEYTQLACRLTDQKHENPRICLEPIHRRHAFFIFDASMEYLAVVYRVRQLCVKKPGFYTNVLVQ